MFLYVLKTLLNWCWKRQCRNHRNT